MNATEVVTYIEKTFWDGNNYRLPHDIDSDHYMTTTSKGLLEQIDNTPENTFKIFYMRDTGNGQFVMESIAVEKST